MLKVLIAEDDRELCQFFSHVLIKNEYTVKGVSNGRKALDAMDTDYFDIILQHGRLYGKAHQWPAVSL